MYTYHKEREVRGVPAWLVAHYLEKLGATPVAENCWQGNGIRVEIRPLDPVRVGGLSVGRLLLVMDAVDASTFEQFYKRLDLMLMRGGG